MNQAPSPVGDSQGFSSRWATEGVDQPWSIGEAIGVAMGALKHHFVSIVVPPFFVGLLSILIGAAIGAAQIFGRLSPTLAVVSSLAVALVLGALQFGLLLEAAVAGVRNEPVAPGRFGRALRRAPRILIFQLMCLLATALPGATVVGSFFLERWVTEDTGPLSLWIYAAAVPSLLAAAFLGLFFLLTYFFIVDEDAPLMAAMRKSWRTSQPFVGTTFLYSAALMPVALLILIPVFGVIALAFVWLGYAYGYVRATGRNELPWLSPEFASRSIRRLLQITAASLTVVFAGLFVWMKLLPTLRGTAWSIKDAIIRASTILTGVAVILVLLALVLPYILDRLEGRRFTSFVAARHVRSQKSGFLTIISILSICGVAISSCALSSVVSVMGGFSQDLQRKILGNNAHIVIDTTAGVPFTEYDATLAKVRAVPSVIGATGVVHGEVMASSASNLAGVVVTGVDPESIRGVIDLVHNIEIGKLEYLEHPEALLKLPANEVIGIGPGGEQYLKGADLPGLPDDIDPAVRAAVINKPDRPGVILGRELAKTLHVYVGDEVTLVSPLGDLGPMGVMPRTKKFRVAAVFYSGMYEYDATYVYTMRDTAQEYFQTGDKISAIEIKVDDAERADVISKAVEAAIARPDLRVRDWREINKNLFSALKLERFATFVILSLAILVASFCIICTLLLMVTEKGKEIAILKAVGASDGTILRTFMIEGMIIGGIGTVFGVVTGLAVCAGLAWFGLRLDPEVYYIDRLPISVNGWDFLKVAGAALSICTLSTLYPAYAASRLRPVDGLRYE
mgnify:CR=1 FL=1